MILLLHTFESTEFIFKSGRSVTNSVALGLLFPGQLRSLQQICYKWILVSAELDSQNSHTLTSSPVLGRRIIPFIPIGLINSSDVPFVLFVR